MPGALSHLKVVDITTHLSGPYCAMLLADQGAEVIKIERPGSGDVLRETPPFIEGESAPFMLWNRNKRSITLDLKDAGDLAVAKRLIAGADIMIENARPGVMERLGLGYQAMHELNPSLVYCSVSGFGQTGPYSRRGGFDLVAQAMSGLMAISGDGFALCCGFESHPWQLFVKKRVVVGVCGLFCLLFALLCFALTLLFAYTCELVTNRCQQRSIKAKARKQVKYTLDSFQEQCFEVLHSLV